MLSNTKLYFALSFVSLALLSSFFYIRTLKAENENLQDNLNQAISTNQNLISSLNQLKIEHQKALNLSYQASQEKKTQTHKIQKVKDYISKEAQNENNVTKLFNVMLDRLWE